VVAQAGGHQDGSAGPADLLAGIAVSVTLTEGCRFGAKPDVIEVSTSRGTPATRKDHLMSRYLVPLPAPEAERASLPPVAHEQGMAAHVRRLAESDDKAAVSSGSGA